MIKLIVFVVAIIGVIIVVGKTVLTANDSSGNESSFSTISEIQSSDLLQHATVTSCWTAIGGVVYDATKVIEKYASIKEALTTVCGKDGSAVFTVQKYLPQQLDDKTIQKINDELKKYKLGVLAP